MQMQLVRSSNIRAVGYEGTTLRITFVRGGTYDYYGVPMQVFNSFIHANSLGKYYIRFIKGTYPAFRVD
jgi:hypothetical protein